MKRYHWAPVIVVGFILFAIVDYQANAGDFKIYTGYPDWRGFAQVDSCGFHGLRAISFSDSDFVHNPMGLELFPLLGGGGPPYAVDRWLRGHSFCFEPDNRDWDGDEMPDHPFFSNWECVGSSEPDVHADNGWARYVQGDSGWIVRDLRHDMAFNIGAQPWRYSTWFQRQIKYTPPESTYYRTDYHAVFRIKIDTSTALDQPEVRLYVWSSKDLPNSWQCALDPDTATLAYSTVTGPPYGRYFTVDLQFHKYYNQGRVQDHCVDYDTTTTETDLGVWTNGEGEVWVDWIAVYDEYAWNTLTGNYNSECSTFINDHYSDPNVKGFKLIDEPSPQRINVNKYWANYLKDNYPGSFKVETSWRRGYNYYRSYWLKDNPVDWFRTSDYKVNHVATDTSSDHYGGGTVRTLQGAMDTVLAYIDSMRIEHDGKKPLVYNTAAGEYYHWHTGDLELRRPTQWEQEAMTWLPVAHGENLVSYWDYNSYYVDCNHLPDTTWACPEDTSAPWVINWHGYKWVAYHRGLVYQDPDQDDSLYRRDPRRVEPNWSVVRRVNKQLRAIGDIISDTSSWQAAFTCDSLGSWVSSFKSDKQTNDKAYVEIATFEHSNIDYLLLVNRRCLSTEGQNVTVELGLPGGQYYILGLDSVGTGYDMYYDFTDFTYSGKLNGKIPFSTYLAPGQGKFFKIIVAARKS